MTKAEKEPDPAPEETEEDGEGKKKKGVGIILIALVALTVAGGAAAAVFFLAPGAKPEAEIAEEDAGHDSDEKKHAEAKPSGHKPKKEAKHGKKQTAEASEMQGGKIEFHGEAAFLVLDPMVISIRPMGARRHLKLALIIETPSEQADALLSRTYHIKDVLNTYLRSVNSDEFEDPAAMSRLRAQIRRRIGAVAPGIAIDQILITEFVLT
jgi:flagellar protein FliL